MQWLDKIMPLNLDRRRDKYAAWLGAARVKEVPCEAVERFSGVDALGFRSVGELVDMAAMEFPSWAAFLGRGRWLGTREGLGTLSERLSDQRLLKYISEIPDKDSRSIFIRDDYYLCRYWNQVEDSVERFPEFDIFQMFCWEHDRYLPPAGYPVLLDSDRTVSRGLAGNGAMCMMLSPMGAARILDFWGQEMYVDNSLELIIYFMSKDSLLDTSRCLSSVSNFVWSGGPISLEAYHLGLDSDRIAIDRLGSV